MLLSTDTVTDMNDTTTYRCRTCGRFVRTCRRQASGRQYWICGECNYVVDEASDWQADIAMLRYGEEVDPDDV